MIWPKLDSGEMRHQISILAPVAVSDESGSNVKLTPILTCKAKIVIVKGTGSDVLQAGQETTQLFITISIWWQAGIRADMQVQTLHGLVRIESVENVLNMDKVLILNCLSIGKNDT